MKKVWLAAALFCCVFALLLCAGCDKRAASKSNVSGDTSTVSDNGSFAESEGENGDSSVVTEFASVQDEAIAMAKALHAADERGGLTESSDESDLYSVAAPTNPAAVQSTGEMTISGEKCQLYTVSDGAGHTDLMAQSESGKWYYKDNSGEYVAITLMDDGTLTRGDLPLNSGSVLSLAEWMLKEFTKSSDCTVKQSGNGLVNGVDCDFYVATNEAGTVLGAVAHGPDGNYYYREKTTFLYRLIACNRGHYFLAEPVSEYEKAALLVYHELSGKTADTAKSVESVVMDDQNATVFAILQGDKTVAQLAVTLDNQWYYDAGAKNTYARVVWTENGVEVS